MKKLIPLLLLLLLPTLAYAETDGDCLYTLVDESGQTLTQRAGMMFTGDEYIAGDNTLYSIVSVDEQAQTATAKRMGESTIDKAALADFYALHAYAEESAKENTSDKKKLICMYSTHSDESYTPTDGTFSKLENAGIYDVGNALKKELEARDIQVVYSEDTFHPHDADAYNRSRATAEELLKKGPDALLDIHRDAIPAEQYETEVDGEDVSKVRLFVGRSNQNQAANKAFAQQIKSLADEKYPGLIKDIYIGKGNYNQELYPQALLLEMGTDDIDKDKVVESTKYLAEVLDDVLFGESAQAEGAKQAKTSSSMNGIAWVIGLAILAAIVYGLASTGSFGGMWNKMKRGTSEMTGGLIGKKPEEEDDK